MPGLPRKSWIASCWSAELPAWSPPAPFAVRKLRQFPVMGLDPDHVVALGAAVQSALVARDAALDDVVMTDVSAFTLGIDVAHQIGDHIREGYYAPP